MNRIMVVSDHPFRQTELVKGAIPTPRLMQEGKGEAYFVPSSTTPGMPGVWFLHEKGYESPTGEYRRVRVVTIEEETPQ